jgi:hypothetical protein
LCSACRIFAYFSHICIGVNMLPGPVSIRAQAHGRFSLCNRTDPMADQSMKHARVATQFSGMGLKARLALTS